MRIQVKVVPRARRPGVDRLADGTWRVRVCAPAEGGRANAEVMEALAERFDVSKGTIRIARGLTGRLKQVEVPVKEG